MITRKLSLILGYECNNNCRFCYCADKRERNIPPKTTKEAKRELEEGIKRGCNFVDFLGGEPAIRKDIFELVIYAKKLGFRTVGMTTNGRMFYYRDFVEKLIKCGLNHVIFSIHGHTPELHDYLTRSPGAFRQATAGMKNVKEINPNIYICTNTVIVRANYKYLPKIAENNIKLGADACEFIFIHPRGNAYRNFEEIVPTFQEIVDYIPKTIKVGQTHKISHFVMRYVPFCYMLGVGYDFYLSEYESRDRLREEHVGPEFRDLDVEKNRREYGRVKGEQCKACKYYNVCEGIFKEYAEKRGCGELIPMS
ncbi:MAG: radical SAM protein [Candidatus Aenigmatarchaeota archaeon]|nr:MAG: radical SAM protein [Candidatus Aenigmarchaeota archaeon]